VKAIVTLTLNPAVDASSEAETVQAVRKVRTTTERFDPGGGGINAARVINELGGRAFAVYLAGGTSGNVLDDLVRSAGLRFHRIHVAEPTRVSHVVYERASGQEYRFTPEGPVVSDSEWRVAVEFLDLLDFDYLLASGSLPRGLPGSFYTRLAEVAAHKGARFVADTSGEPLARVLEHGAYLVKPSQGELAAVLGRDLRDRGALEDAAREVVAKRRVQLLAVTLGKDGALLTHAGGQLYLASPDVPVKSAVGAGDSFLAAMTLALARGDSPERAFAFGVAAGAATAMTPGTELCHRADVERLGRALVAGWE
jgi:6-phosphofructokinase 2